LSVTIAVLFLALILFGYRGLNKITHRLSLAVSEERIARKQERIDDTIDRNVSVAEGIATSPLIRSWLENEQEPGLSERAHAEMANYGSLLDEAVVFAALEGSKNFYANGAYISTLSQDNPDDSWYFMTTSSNDQFNLNIDYNDDLDTRNLWVNMRVGTKEEPLGVVGTGVDISRFVETIVASDDSTGATVLVDDTGLLKAHQDLDLVESASIFEVYEFPAGGESIRDHMADLSETDPRTSFQTRIGDAEFLISMVYLPRIQWYLVTMTDLAGVTRATDFLPLLAATLLAIALIITAVLLLVNRMVLSPVSAMEASVRRIAEGDLSAAIHVSQKDEIGALGTDIEQFRTSLQDTVESLKAAGMENELTKNRLLEATDRASTSAEGIKREAAETGTRTTELTTILHDTRGATERIAEGADSLNSKIQEQATMVEQSSAAITEMSQSVENVARIARSREEATGRLVEQARIGGDRIEGTVSAVKDISGSVDEINELVSLLSAIASQTNLLSMNAAIEAAHAGEAGKGFAVVAEEIRSLAENSAEQSNRISGNVSLIVERINAASTASEDARKTFDSLNTEVQTVTQAFHEITGATDELRAGSEEILKAIGSLQEVTSTVTGQSGEIRSDADAIRTAIGSVHEISGATAAGMDQIQKELARITQIVEDVRSLGQSVGEGAALVRERLAVFTNGGS
jgi:methyl-accepting chemotaxis protein